MQKRNNRKPSRLTLKTSKNATGYEKRAAQKEMKTSTSEIDVYEYKPEVYKRANVKNYEMERDRSGTKREESDDDGEQLEPKVRLVGEQSEEQIDSEDDDEINSDDAFEESDEERYADYNFARKTPQKRKLGNKTHSAKINGEVDLDEYESSGSGGSGAEEGEENVSEDEEDMGTGKDAAPEALEELGNFISKLDPGSKRKEPETVNVDDGSRSRKRRHIEEQTEAGVEGEFHAHSSGSKLQLDDLLAPLATHSSALISLQNSAKILASTSSTSKKLAAPLPQRAQEKLDREAAYEKTKEEIDKWSATMKRIKEAEHLSFPLQQQPVVRVSNLELTAKFKPTTEMESAVDKLLKSARMRDEDIQKTEELKMSHLSVEEVEARRAELRKTRELMFRAEVKARRIAKIKSKAYRRIKKKGRERLEAKLDEGMDVDEEEARLKADVERARERATLRHKHTLDKGELLRKKIQDLGDGDDSQDSESEGGESDAEVRVSRIKERVYEELSKLDADESNTDSPAGKRSIFDMKFMKEGAARAKAQADQLRDDFIKELEGLPNEEQESETINEDHGSRGLVVSRVGGRVVYRPGPSVGDRTYKKPESVASSVTLLSTDVPTASPPPDIDTRPFVPIPATGAPNPWLVPREDALNKVALKKNEVVIDKNSGDVEKSRNKLKKSVKKREEERAIAQADAEVEISMDNVLILGNRTKEISGSAKQKRTEDKPTTSSDGDDSDHNSEIEAQELAVTLKGEGKKRRLRAFEQRDLVALAFAGDNVVQSFQEAKQKETDADAPKEVDTTLAGWGSWGGAGTRRVHPKPHLVKKIPGIVSTARADYGNSHVIISEKRDKKAAKYQLRDLPYPFTSKAQYERSMGQPIGVEWNTRVGFQRGTLPRVVKKMGAIINPLEKLS